MDTRRILSTSLLLGATLMFASQSPEDIYKRSVKVLSVDKIKFQVKSLMQSKNYKQEQIFTLARYTDAENSSSLVCFLYPKNIKGTAILIKNESTLVYFPSLGRSRLVPKEDEDNEAFGLGLSFAEIQNNTSKLKNLGEIQKGSRSYYQLEKETKKQKIIYLIEKKSMIIQEMKIYQNTQLIKKVIIDEVALFHNKKIITKWHIVDYKKDKTTTYSVNKKSITSSFSKRIFKRSAISHCRS